MRRSIRPDLEMLEGKALLSGVSAAGLAPGLVDSLTAVASRTLTGAKVVESYTETNVSDHDITVAHGPSDDGFTATQAGKIVYNPADGIIAEFLVLDDLKPHQSLTVSNTWDVRSNLGGLDEEGPALSGTFTISNELDQGKATASVTIPKGWTVPVKLTHVPAPKPPALHHS